MQEIDIRDIFHIIKKRIWIILLITAIIFAAGVIFTFQIATPQYKASTTIYIGRNVAEGATADDILYQDLLLGEKLVNDYRELVKSRLVSDEVRKRLTHFEVTADDITKYVDVEAKTNTRVIEISATTDSKQLSMEMANETANVFIDKALEIMDVQNVQVIDEAIFPENQITPNITMNLAISFLLGLMLGVGFTFLIEFLDNKIRTPEDVETILDLPVLGVILSFDNEEKITKKIKTKQKKNGGKRK